MLLIKRIEFWTGMDIIIQGWKPGCMLDVRGENIIFLSFYIILIDN